MNIMTVESRQLFLEIDKISEHLDMANTLYEILSKNITNYDFDVLKMIDKLKTIILQEKAEFVKAIQLTKDYLEKQNGSNMKMVQDLCKQTEAQMKEAAINNPILSYF